MTGRAVRWGSSWLMATALIVCGCGQGGNKVEKPDKFTPPPSDSQRLEPGKPPPPKPPPKIT